MFRWNGTSWELVGGQFTAMSGTPSATILTIFNGQLVVGGRFSACNGVPCDSVAVWNGTNWGPLGGFGLEGVSTVRSLAEWQGSLAAVVETLINGVPGAQLFAYSGGGWGLLTNALPTDAKVFANGPDLYVVGNLPPQISGAGTYLLARWANGFWTPAAEDPAGSLFNRANSAAFFNGQIVLAGRFDAIGDRRFLGIATLAPDGWRSLGIGFDQPIRGFAESVGQVVAWGDFRHAGLVDAHSVARWDGTVWHAMGLGLAPTVLAVRFFEDQPVAAGTDLLGSSPGAAVARFDGTIWTAIGTGLSGTARALAEFNGELIAAGSLTIGDPPVPTAVARWDGQAWHPIPFGISYAYAVAVYQGRLVATTVGDAANGGRAVLAWDGQAVTSLGSGFARSGSSFAYPNVVRVFGEDLIVAGIFTTAGGVPCTNIAAWNGQSWRALGTGVAAQAIDLAEYRGRLVAFSGSSSNAGNIRQWDGVSWTYMPASIGGASAAIELDDGRLLVNSSSVRSESTRSFSLTFYTDDGLCRADFDCSGQVTLQDLFDFLSAYFTGDGRADMNGTGTVTVGDVFAFIEYYFKPC
ncbi:MAG: hypothetical protein IT438_05915 [Phycisphaerales bacterium]|nr:hypothetical protein [Phycisphaerales bacterium]